MEPSRYGHLSLVRNAVGCSVEPAVCLYKVREATGSGANPLCYHYGVTVSRFIVEPWALTAVTRASSGAAAVLPSRPAFFASALADMP